MYGTVEDAHGQRVCVSALSTQQYGRSPMSPSRLAKSRINPVADPGSQQSSLATCSNKARLAAATRSTKDAPCGHACPWQVGFRADAGGSRD